MKLLIATRNAHKLREIRAILHFPGLEMIGAGDIPSLPEVLEDGGTFEANAIKKAVTLALQSHMWTLADDSGLEVPALGGEPGVRSARYAGEPVDYDANNRKLLAAMAKINDRKARFRCAIALASPSGRAQVVEGRCEGEIATAPRGDNGFGYDPVFIPNGYPRTFAEVDPETKNAISHRAAALRRARETWSHVLSSLPPDWPRRNTLA